MVRLTLAEDHFNPKYDYIEVDENGVVVGMWADYYTDGVTPVTQEIHSKIYSEITYTGLSPKLNIGGNYRTFTVKFYDDMGETKHHNGEWKFTINDVDISSLISIKEDKSLPENQIKIKFIGDDSYIGQKVRICYISEDKIKSYVEMNIGGL